VPCLPTPAKQCKSGPAWVHEIKHDGYRMIARRTGDRVRLYTRRGFNWADRYPRIVEALRSLRVRSIVIDGEAKAARARPGCGALAVAKPTTMRTGREG
jgi:bifunctional non-homologous end joining protein LigD